MKLDLETLKQVKFTFELHSDHSTNCNGYRRLCEMIIEAEREASQQTAVEWLYETLWKQTDFSLPNNIFEQAKAMEKEQMDKVSEDWFVEGLMHIKDNKRIYQSFEEYYNKIYKK